MRPRWERTCCGSRARWSAIQSLRESRFHGAGRRVQVNRGPLKGLRGEFVRSGTESLLILRVDFLGKAAELAIDEACVDPE